MKKLVLSLAFVGFGAFAMAQQQQKMPPQMDPETMQQRQDQRLAQMQRDLNLSPSQVSQIKALQDKRQGERMNNRIEMQKAKKMRQDKMKKNRQEMDNDMKRILTPEQYQKWQTMRQNRMNKGGQRMNHPMPANSNR